ncbi:MAG: xanthine dehydrogenase family protein molybdopterin-binding subunit [Chloroflexota bacterium]
MTGIGSRSRRVEDPLLITGQGRYVGDMTLPSMLHAGFVRSPHAHARINSIDLAPARAMEGVVAAYAAADLPGLCRPGWVAPGLDGFSAHGYTPLATDTVRYVGEPVAVILAESAVVIEDAVEAAVVEYDALPVSGDPLTAPPRADVWADSPNNTAEEMTIGYGDIETAFEIADVVCERTFTFPRAAGAAIETRAVLARFEDGELTVWTSSQIPHGVRNALAGHLDLDPESVRVVTPHVGGGFGVKGRVYPEEYVVATVAMEQGRPVRYVGTRSEDLTTTCQGRAQRHRARIAASRDGRLLGLEVDFIQDLGAYAPNGMPVPFNTSRHLMGPYHLAALSVRAEGAYSNRVMTSPLRGGGRPQGVFVVERMMDALADELGLDRAEVRRRNLLQSDDFPYDTKFPSAGGTVVYDSGQFPRYLAEVIAAIDIDSFRDQQERARRAGRYLGLGLTCFIESTGMGAEGARVRLCPDGTLNVRVGSPSQGQGHATVFAQVAADRLGVALSEVDYRSGDTAAFPWGTGTFASRMSQFGGNAVAGASNGLRAKILALAADMLEIAPEDLEIAHGQVSVRGAPNRGVSLAEVAAEADARDQVLDETFAYQPERGTTWAGGASGAVVEVDVETGKIDVRRYVVAHDAGTLLNPAIVEGQIQGGIAHGIGNALFEESVYGLDGQPLTATFSDYAVPLSGDVPPVEIIHVETPSPFNPEGIKGAGEGGTITAIPTIVSAVEDALTPFRARFSEIPLTPERVLRAIREGRSRLQEAR